MPTIKPTKPAGTPAPETKTDAPAIKAEKLTKEERAAKLAAAREAKLASMKEYVLSVHYEGGALVKTEDGKKVREKNTDAEIVVKLTDAQANGDWKKLIGKVNKEARAAGYRYGWVTAIKEKA